MSDAGITAKLRTARMVSAAPSYAIAQERYRYEPKSNAKAKTMTLATAPRGMTLRGAVIEWTPEADQVGKQRVVLKGQDDSGNEMTQEFDIDVATATLMAEGEIGAESGGTVVAATPRAGRLIGAGAQVPARALKSSINLTVSELDQAPSTPNARGAVRPVRFGPGGTVFDAPARISLPLPEGAQTKSRLGAYVYNPAGRWERARVVAVDLDNGLLTAEAQHFSIYAAVESSVDLEATLARAGADSACESGLVARAVVTSPLSAVELGSVNNLSAGLRARIAGEAPSVQDLLSLPEFQGSLRTVQVLELVEQEGTGELVRERVLLATTLYVPGDGSAHITHADALGNVIASKHYPQPLLELADLEQRLRGAATAVHFRSPALGSLGVAARVHLAYYEGDASLDPISDDDLGLAAVDRPAVFGAADGAVLDGDCDGVVDAFDASDDRLLARVEATPSWMTQAFAGESITLAARVVRGQAASSSWSVDSEATLEAVPNAPDARSFKADKPGRYVVSYRADVSGRALENVFAIDVLDKPAVNTPPTCKLAKYIDSARVGETIGLSAVASDAETAPTALRVEWGLVDDTTGELVPVSALSSSGPRAMFAPISAGKFTVGCRAFDGQLYGAIGQVVLSVAEAAQNRAPELMLSPLSKAIALGESLALSAWAKDPDGDPITFDWQVEGAEHGTAENAANESRLRVTGSSAGVIKVVVRASDGKAPPVEAVARLLVDVPVGEVDADRDGWPAGKGPLADCDDKNPRVHPTASEQCGDSIDYDCDGIVRADDCDGDGYTVAQGDCDDANKAVYPKAFDLCDGLDNDCNKIVDDRFSVGASCVQGSGLCQSVGKLECSADGLFTMCSARPILPQKEVCDRADNDCDGLIDEDNVCGGAGTDPRADAGAGTGDAGAPGMSDAGVTLPPDAAVPEQRDGSVAVGDAGVGGTVRDAGEGGTVGDDGGTRVVDACYPYTEICDGIDNDCDGLIDENAVCQCDPKGKEDCYDRVDNDCDGLIDAADSDCGSSCQYQGPEQCQDRVDNDCDGLIDGADTECQGTIGESCVQPRPIGLGVWYGDSFKGRSDDLKSSCRKGVDAVYQFTLKTTQQISVSIEGDKSIGWAIYQGSCSTQYQEVSELSCNEGKWLEPGNYFLVVEGDQGLPDYSVMVTGQEPVGT